MRATLFRPLRYLRKEVRILRAASHAAWVLFGPQFRKRIVARTQAGRGPRTEQQVVFVSDRPGSREAKLAYGLRQLGWRVILLHRELPTFAVETFVDRAHRFRTRREALQLCSEFRPAAFHIFSTSEFTIATTIIRSSLHPIVFDDYDVFAGMMTKKGRVGQFGLERYCLENADALCCRSLETQFARRDLYYRYQGPRILITDGCWNQPASLPHQDEDIHVVYIGNVPSGRTCTPPHARRSFIAYLDSITKHGIHLHIYPAQILWQKDSESLERLQHEVSNETLFHLHAPVPPDQLPAELSRYHAGLFDSEMFSDSYAQMYTAHKYAYAATNKIFDYIDAGLPVLIRSTKFQEFIVRHYGVGRIVTDELWQTLSLEQLSLYRSNIRGLRQSVSTVENARRLIELYKELALKA